MQAYCALRAIVMCILRCTSVAAPLVLNANTLRVCSFTLLPVRCKHQGKRVKETPSQVRVFALAGAIGIEPTQWESEAQVLPLHQAPSRELLYITKDCFAIDFLCRNKKITTQMIFFEIIDLFLLQK